MNSQQDVIYGLMNELEEALDNKGFPLLGFSVVKKDTTSLGVSLSSFLKIITDFHSIKL